MTSKTHDVLAIRLEELEKRLNLQITNQETARTLAAIGIHERLEKMNEFRAQLDRQAGGFVTKEMLESKVDQIAQGLRQHDLSDTASHEQHEVRLRILETFRSNYEGRFWALGVGMAILVVVLQFLSRLVKF
jgi:hypothetical protein